jgi:hypothetical protein
VISRAQDVPHLDQTSARTLGRRLPYVLEARLPVNDGWHAKLSLARCSKLGVAGERGRCVIFRLNLNSSSLTRGGGGSGRVADDLHGPLPDLPSRVGGGLGPLDLVATSEQDRP